MLHDFGVLRRLVETVTTMISHVAVFASLLFLTVYIYALLGMELFANRLRFDEHGYRLEMDDPAWHTAADRPRANFDDLFSALVTVFQVRPAGAAPTHFQWC